MKGRAIMDEFDYYGGNRSFGRKIPQGCMPYMVVGLLIIVALTVALFAIRGFEFPNLFGNPKPTIIVGGPIDSYKPVYKQEYIQENVVFPIRGQVGCDWPILRDICGMEQTVLIYGVAVAGTDYEQHPQQVKLDENGTLHVTLPAPGLLHRYINYDPDKTQVIQASGLGIGLDRTQLANETNIKAVEKIEEVACKSDLLRKASEEAKIREELYWREVGDDNPGFDIRDVVITVQDGGTPIDGCDPTSGAP